MPSPPSTTPSRLKSYATDNAASIYIIKEPEYYTTEAPKYYTTELSAPAYYTDALKYYSAPSYYQTEAPVYYT
ncbi:hypothetical protein DAPPUDRAFT_332887 [Daphnia pulex]|uniref:Uncharacterized protein n=1 Tax=Daphnia pulex TaxID=6669 RepID=E9HR79_DAPPU|nr:hypothetical protein DAPPUDRAFT_332887 [Daphnia pulex]|eukprot:EFX65758.1 hypothetical protein DAPPUDRAFT_332887 [Daphnia pulex]